MGRVSTMEQMVKNLNSKMALGQSRHLAKNQVKDEYQRTHDGQKMSAVEIRVDTIHSIKTREAYQEHCTHFIEYCQNERGRGKYTPLEKLEQYAKDYLAMREEQGKSLYTLKAEKAALGKLYGHEIDYKFKQARTVDKITRSRDVKENKMDKHFSEKRNRDLVTVCKGTGGRREDIGKLTPRNFFTDRNGALWVKFEQSKGGRDRVAPVLPKYQEQIRAFIQTKEPHEHLFYKVHGGADVHAYRREYAQSLYQLVCEDREKQREYASHYPERQKGVYDTYYARGERETAFRGLKDDIYIVSEALGHNRLSVTVNHYLK